MVSEQGPILVGGAPSTGTTILSVMLDAHPEIFCGPELAVLSHPALFTRPFAQFRQQFAEYLAPDHWRREDPIEKMRKGFCPYVLLYEDNLNFYGLNRKTFLADLYAINNLDQLLAHLFEACSERDEKKIWAEKTPGNIYSFRAFLDRFTNGRVVYMVRDPRDQIYSLLRRGYDFRDALSIWLVDTAVCELLRDVPRAHAIKYEDLVKDTEGTLITLLDFLEITPEVDAMLDHTNKSQRIAADATLRGTGSWQAVPSEPVSTKPVGGGSKAFTPAQVTLLRGTSIVDPPPGYGELTGTTALNLASRLGYTLETDKDPSEKELLDLCASEALFIPGSCFSGSDLHHSRCTAFTEYEPWITRDRFVTAQSIASGSNSYFQQRFGKRMMENHEKLMERAHRLAAACDHAEAKRAEIERNYTALQSEYSSVLTQLTQVEKARAQAESQRAGSETNYLTLQAQHNELLRQFHGLEQARARAERKRSNAEFNYSELQRLHNDLLEKFGQLATTLRTRQETK